MTDARAVAGAYGDLRALLFANSRGDWPTPDGVRGVIVEVEVEGGLIDSVAAYSDGSARYLNHRGAVIVWEVPGDADMAAKVDTLLTAARPIMQIARPITTPVPLAPPVGEAQIAVLATDGILTGRGPYEVLSRDAVAGPVIKAAFELMTALMGRQAQAREGHS